MSELETDMIENTIIDRAYYCRKAIAAGNASDAAAFARGAVRASRQLGEQEASERQAERVAEPMLKLTTPGPVITIEPTERGYRLRLPDKCAPCAGAIGGFKAMRWMAYHDSPKGAYRSFPKDRLAEVQDFLRYWFVEAGNDGRNRNGDKPATVRVIEIDQNAAATVRWSNGDYAGGGDCGGWNADDKEGGVNEQSDNKRGVQARVRPFDDVQYAVLKAAATNDAEEFNPNPLTAAQAMPQVVGALRAILNRANQQQASGGDKMDFQDSLRVCGDIARHALAALEGENND